MTEGGLPYGWHVEREGASIPEPVNLDNTDHSDGPPGPLVTTSEFATLVAEASRHDIDVDRDSVAAACLTGAIRGWKRSGRWQVDASEVPFAAVVIDRGLERLLEDRPELRGHTLRIEFWVPRGRSGAWVRRGEPGWLPPALSFLPSVPLR